MTQNYADGDAASGATKAAKVQSVSQRLLFALYDYFKHLTPFLRDISQAYTQSETDHKRDVFIRAPKARQLPTGTVLRVIKQLYMIPESDLKWY